MRERIQNIHIVNENYIVAGGRKGQIYLLDSNLNIVKQSRNIDLNNPIYKIVSTSDFIFTKDNAGNIVKWDIDSLEPLDILISSEYKDESGLHEDDLAVSSPNHALEIYNNKLYSSNGYGQILELDLEELSVERILDPNKESFTEYICSDKKDVHVLSDFRGWLYKGSLDTGIFEKAIRIDDGPVHCVKYDKKHDRFWGTTDNRYGITIVDGNLENAEHYSITNDDVEWITFNKDYSLAYVACFDHYLYIYSNKNKQIQLKNKIGPFKFQLNQVCYVNDETIYVVLESGEVYQVNGTTGNIMSSIGNGNCIWGMDEHPDHPEKVYCALEDGSVSVVCYESDRYNSIKIKEVERFHYSFGRIRRSIPLKDSGFIAISTNGTVFRADASGDILWHKQLKGICRDVAYFENRVLVGTEDNYAMEMSLDSGEMIAEFSLELPVWAVCYDLKGNLILGMRRKMIRVLDANTKELITNIELLDNIKRFRVLNNGNILVNGPEGIVELNASTWKVEKRWAEWVTTTCENAIVDGNYVYGITYSSALISYNYHDSISSNFLDIQNVSDYPKGMVIQKGKDGTSVLLVGGRGPYINAYRLVNGIPQKVRELILQ
ncbi:hypothetical protein [Chengkuizengella axinellae]|uniref:WD40 repeat domain-containing protein n=1 Tax=Chengkuizengella axinellae TaxID=3064388 RepID=A0ABT9J1G2_9BACL|nr:hypothetical protein [Chengkuizengella sp. 2205SS18-9]MDP5274844.1 hypothetical protein [Chengkuizengella sp. 2205SS18-9]